MLKTIAVCTALATPALGQMTHSEGMAHSSSTTTSHALAGMAQPAINGVGGSPLIEGGQSAFTAIAEVVNLLRADPNTDWNSVDIDALRDHLRDMDIVTIDSSTITKEVPGGLRFEITGEGDVQAAIRRMVSAHAGMMDGQDGWAYQFEETAGGANMTITTPEQDLPVLKALGFYGIMASGMHHQPHHWAMATGSNPHQH